MEVKGSIPGKTILDWGVELRKARSIVEAFVDPDHLNEPAEIVATFIPPKDDAPSEGRVTKRWIGKAIDVAMALASFSTRLYEDGGRVLEIEMVSRPHPSVSIFRLIDGAKWEEAVYGRAS